ncbi:MAG: beta-phosphoglucomutase [Alphaproteobacteria bacterium]|nr:MAG: beta-phosphoglucomutase [Alphaproteobacteria bacterium]
MMPDAMLFDLDGVIADTAGLHFAAWRRLARELGGDLPNSFEVGLKGLSRKDSLERILAFLGNTVGDEEQQRLMARKNAWYRDSLKCITAADALPGARSILEAARQAGIALALVSQSRNAPEILGRLELAQFFDHVVDPSKVARGKPSPDIFLAAAGALNVAPAHCIGIEDAPAGVLAIRRAGMFALGIGARDELDKAHMVRADLASVDLRQLFARWQAWRTGADAGKSGQSAKL